METCNVDGCANDSTFDELVEAMQDDLYWVRFFVRPCCPAPDLEGAVEMLDHLARDIEAREDFTFAQKSELAAVIASRKRWYATSGLCRSSRA